MYIVVFVFNVPLELDDTRVYSFFTVYTSSVFASLARAHSAAHVQHKDHNHHNAPRIPIPRIPTAIPAS